jgi:hypothetical protein
MNFKNWFNFSKPTKSEKQIATEKGEPFVTIVDFSLDKTDLSNGSFELDFNDIFVARLIKAGFKGKNDYEIVDHWFSTICRNIVLETFEQELADPDKRAAWENHNNS